MASAIIAEAALSFLGLGVPPEIPTWGSMLSGGRAYISTSWWLALFPGLCISSRRIRAAKMNAAFAHGIRR